MAHITGQHAGETGAADRGQMAAPSVRSAARPLPRFVLPTLMLAGGALLAGAVLLWQRHGATVFFDTLTAGIAACL